MALRFGPNSARNRNTSLIRRISALGLGTTATPPKRPDSSRDYFDVSGGSPRQRTGEFTGLRWRFRPASDGDYNRPRVAITSGPCKWGNKIVTLLNHHQITL